jgi:predicted phage terminase large subunit-like protein
MTLRGLVGRAEYDAQSRKEFYPFLLRTFVELNPGDEYVDNWHVAALAAELEAVERGEVRRLIINQPPRSLKSIAVSVAFVAWTLGRDPTRLFLCVSYGLELAEKLARDCRQVMQSAWYQTLFPATRLSPARTAVTDFQTTAGGGRLAASRNSAITGRGAHYILIDDPVKPEEMHSESMRASTAQFVTSTLLTRLNKKTKGAVVLACQRLHDDDLPGRLLRVGGWRHFSLSAIAQKKEVFTWETRYGPGRRTRYEGDVLHPAHEPLSVLNQLRAELGEYYFSAQYLQEPAALKGNFVNLDWFARYKPADIPDTFDEIIQSWDTATKTKEVNDYSVCVTIGRKAKRYWVLSVERVKLEHHELKQRVQASYFRDRPQRILIEENTNSTPLIQDLKRLGFAHIEPCPARGEKEMRLLAATAMMAAGHVYLPYAAPWLVEFEHELAVFPHARYDDQVDALSQGLNWLNGNGHEPHITRFYREEVEAMLAAEKPSDKLFGVRPGRWMTAPPYAVAITSIPDGGFTSADADGVFWVPEYEYRGLLLNGWEAV